MASARRPLVFSLLMKISPGCLTVDRLWRLRKRKSEVRERRLFEETQKVSNELPIKSESARDNPIRVKEERTRSSFSEHVQQSSSQFCAS